MARFRALANGDIVQFLGTYEQEKTVQAPPGTTYQLQFDESTNAGLIAAYQQNGNQFRMDGGTLTQNDVPATINPDSLFYAAFRDRANMLSKAAETADPFTREEVARILAVTFRLAGF